MEQIFLIITKDKIVIEEKLNEIIKKYTDVEVVHYDLTEVPINKVIEDLDTYNFLANKKIIVGHNANFLSEDKIKTLNPDSLNKYIDNPSKENILVLISENISKKNETYLKLEKSATIILEKLDIHNLIKRQLEDYKMDFNAERVLLDYCQNDSERILNEIEKLKLYKLNEKIITKEDIEENVIRNMDDNIFHLIDSMISGNKKYAFLLYKDFMLHGEQVVNIIRILSSKIRLIYQVKTLLKDGNSDKSISSLLDVKEYPIKLARELGYKFSEKKLLDNLEKLAKLDLEIKSGETTGEVEFEEFLATI